MNTLSTSKQKLSLAFKIIKDTVQGFVDDNVMRLSASLAYATLFSIIPLFSLLITIIFLYYLNGIINDNQHLATIR